MKKLILAAAAAAFLIPAIPGAVSTASAQDVTVRLNSDNGHHYGWRHNHAYRSYASSGCRTVTTRTRHNGRVIIKKVRRCY
jgi:hypothetical protein